MRTYYKRSRRRGLRQFSLYRKTLDPSRPATIFVGQAHGRAPRPAVAPRSTSLAEAMLLREGRQGQPNYNLIDGQPDIFVFRRPERGHTQGNPIHAVMQKRRRVVPVLIRNRGWFSSRVLVYDWKSQRENDSAGLIKRFCGAERRESHAESSTGLSLPLTQIL